MSPVISTYTSASARGYGAFLYLPGEAPPPVEAGTVELIATVSPTPGSSAVYFTDIPQTYKHLRIAGSVGFDVTDAALSLIFNNDSNYNYGWSDAGIYWGNYDYPSGSYSYTEHWNAMLIANQKNLAFPYPPYVYPYPPQAYTAFTYDIPFYTNSFDKMALGYSGDYGYNQFGVGRWANTSPIISIGVSCAIITDAYYDEVGSGSSFTSGSTVSLYGFKGL